jgi:osmotically-inducible protein OsmY
MNKIIVFLSFLFMSFNLSSCIPAIVGGAVGGGTTAIQERPVGKAVDDSAIWAKIKGAFFKNNDSGLILKLVRVKVSEGRVLLTGEVPTAEDRLTAVKLTWEQDGVKEVLDEIKVQNSEKKEHIVTAFAADSLITTQIRSKLLFSDKVKSVNYSIETIEKIVYIMGIAQNETELNEVIDIAAGTRGVVKVVNYARLKDSTLRKR